MYVFVYHTYISYGICFFLAKLILKLYYCKWNIFPSFYFYVIIVKIWEKVLIFTCLLFVQPGFQILLLSVLESLGFCCFLFRKTIISSAKTQFCSYVKCWAISFHSVNELGISSKSVFSQNDDGEYSYIVSI